MLPSALITSQLLIVFAVSLCCAAALILAERWHISLTGDKPDESAHKIHPRTVPRVGGVGVYVAGLTGLALISRDLHTITAEVIWMMWGCMTIVFVAGLVEDLTRAVPASARYVAALVAAGLFSLAHDSYGISSVGIGPIDITFNSSIVRVAFFAFAVASLSHAFNLVDGQNGLCSGVSILVFVALGITAARTGQATLAQLSFVMAAANLGFFVFNFPYGRIFLGDGGAYFNGAIAAVITVFVVQGSSLVSPWLAILILIYPVWETLFSIGRRIRARQPFHLADNYHLHHLAAVALNWRQVTKSRQLVAAPILLATAPFILIAPLLLDQTLALLSSIGCFVVGYVLLYRRLQRSITPP